MTNFKHIAKILLVLVLGTVLIFAVSRSWDMGNDGTDKKCSKTESLQEEKCGSGCGQKMHEAKHEGECKKAEGEHQCKSEEKECKCQGQCMKAEGEHKCQEQCMKAEGKCGAECKHMNAESDSKCKGGECHQKHGKMNK